MFNMAGKSAVLAAGFFLIILASFGAESSERVPDGLVYTELKKKLVQGITGMLSCRFSGEPFAVYWRKGSDIDNLSPIILWDDQGTIAGPGYDDGSCNIDVNSYSLIIKNVSMTDAGRFYCAVSNHLGILVKNYTDVVVVDTAMETRSHVTLQMRSKLPGILQCTVHIRPRMVTWIKKGITYSSDETLVTIEGNGTGIRRSGAGYDQGILDITNDYSLIINNVEVQNKGLYVCEVTDFDTGHYFYDQSHVNIAAPPLEPFPTILECLHDQSDPSYCTLFAESQTLTCHVNEYYPDIHLHFLYGSKKVDNLETREWHNTDGTKNKTISIATVGTKELYFCVASNIPGTPDNKSASILLIDEEPLPLFILVITLIGTLTVICLVIFIIWRRRHTSDSRAEHIELKGIDADAKCITQGDFRFLQEDVNRALRQHCSKMSSLFYKKVTPNADKFIAENRTALLDTHQMLTDYLHISKPNPSSSETIQGYRGDWDQCWPSDEELKLIACHLKLKRDSVQNMCKKLKLGYTSADGNDKGKVLSNLREWRDREARKYVEDKHKQLSEVCKSNNIRGLLPPLKRRCIYKAELVDMAFHLLMHDFLPIAEEWGVHAIKLISYRPAFQPSHLEIGTINLLSKLLKEWNNCKTSDKNMRSFLFGELKLSRNVTIRGLIAYEMSYGELFRILEAMTQNAGVRSLKKGSDSYKIHETEVEGGTSDVTVGPQMQIVTYDNSSTNSTHTDVVEEVDIEKGEKEHLLEQPDNHGSKLKLSEILLVLQKALQLTDQDISESHSSAKPINAYDMFKIWKEKPRSSVFNYRSALAHQLRNMEMPSLADVIISGKYITEETSLEFIQSVVQRMSTEQLDDLKELLGLIGEDICKEIYDWMEYWTKEMKGSHHTKFLSQIKKPTEALLQRHRDLNDTLVEHGFLDLAREIMITEQNIA